ncbi:N-lysine methyltransferase SMYD2-A [Geodia barretti]|uniref:N-lysine methyltransferase SMYD2-A n=1 Tax=Geodia barretti TaxID=519541 RepID=A0AA35X486_GEOBA|nr:N-lysine methyltransferase SMYD2-A [Geodia barretti]
MRFLSERIPVQFSTNKPQTSTLKNIFFRSLLKCGRCKYVRYCSKTCQRGDWRFHKGECGGIARAQPHSPTPLARLVVRCLLVDAEVR